MEGVWHESAGGGARNKKGATRPSNGMKIFGGTDEPRTPDLMSACQTDQKVIYNILEA